MKFIIITGMSGAGKSQAVKVFEDLGYYVVDNMPPSLLPKFSEIIVNSESKFEDVALVMDIRAGRFFNDIDENIKKLSEQKIDFEILFIDASDEELVKRFKETRRAHPLSSKERLITGIEKERKILDPIKKKADVVIDTTGLALRKFQEKIKKRFFLDSIDEFNMMVNVVSFGFKYGIPLDCDLAFDVRFIENPFYIEELRPLSGLDEPVRKFVIENQITQEFINKIMDLLKFLIPHYIEEGKKQLIIGIGCTGGRHRSVAIAEAIAEGLRNSGFKSNSVHRDLEEDMLKKRS